MNTTRHRAWKNSVAAVTAGMLIHRLQRPGNAAEPGDRGSPDRLRADPEALDELQRADGDVD